MRPHPKLAAVAGFIAIPFALVLGGASARAQVSPNGDQFQVNTYATYDQDKAAIAADGQGSFVVVWESLVSSSGDPSYAILAQRYEVDGVPLGGEFLVNSYTPYYQYRPAAAADPQGNFVVVWESYGSNGNDTSGFSIQGRLFTYDGTPSGQFQINTYTNGGQVDAGVARAVQGNFVVVWTSFGSPGSDTGSASVQARRYDGIGIPQGDQFQVNSYTTGDQIRSAAAVDAQGNFIVVWDSNGGGSTDATGWSVQGQRYAANGTPLGGQFQVNSYTTGNQTYPAVGADDQGDFVVVWQSFGSSSGDASGYSIQGQRFDASGAPLGGEFQVNSYTTNAQRFPSLAMDPEGYFVVTWQSDGSAGGDSSDTSIQSQRYTAAGLPLGGEFQVNTYSDFAQDRPAVAADGLGNFVVAWESYGSPGNDSSYKSVQARRYDGLFRDGFETGDLSRWLAPP